MLEFRISGETAEVGCLADQLERAGYVVRRSKPYRNRDEEGCRIYLEMDEDKVMGWMLANLEKASLDDELPPISWTREMGGFLCVST